MADLAPGDEFAGCRIEAEAGRGGMGVVYRATQLALGRPVALKLLAADHAGDPDFRERFQRESRMAAAIDHPNVIPVFAAGEEDGRLYLVMRYVGGTDLQGLLRAGGALDDERAADIVAQVADALDAAHAAGLVHRDVKPANVLLSGDHAYLSDFGLTRLVDAETEITQSGQWIGTVDYCAPEQLRGEAIDARADVYALGCVLYAALTGEAPFHRGTVPSTLAAQLHDPPPRPSERGARAEFDRVIARALAKDPADRYPSAGDLGRAAVAAARGEAVTESERSVAVGPAAPTLVNGHHDLPTAVTSVAADGGERAIYRPVRLLRSALTALACVAALAGIGLALGALLGSGPSPRTGPLSEDEVRATAEAFGSAYERESVPALRRTLAADVLRVLPTGVARGRAAVVAQYARQFDGRVRGYTYSNLEVTGGSAGRASADYRVDRADGAPITGHIVLGMTREGGRARIRLIAATPSS